MRNVIYDIETNGFLDYFDKVHCIVVRDVDSDEVLSCTDDSDDYAPLSEALRVLNEAENIYGHNIIRFDHPALVYHYPEFNPQARRIDTLVLARTRWAHIKQSDYGRAKKGKLPAHLIGNHSLEAWGYRLGIHKGEYTDWCKENGIEEPFAEWRPEMQEYCEQDTAVNKRLLLQLRQSGLPEEVIETELELAEYLAQQERNGWPFDFDRAVELQATLSARREELATQLKDRFGWWYAPGKEFTPKRDNSRYGYVEGATCTKLKVIEFNPGSTQHIANRLAHHYGWEPESFTNTGLPQVTEGALKSVQHIPEVEPLIEYLMIDKRLGMLAEGKEAWLKKMSDAGREGSAITHLPHIHHSVGNVTVTHRHRHSHPNIAQVPKTKTDKDGNILWGKKGKWGADCRALFTVPDGWVQLGADASGLELRCLAHYMAKYDDGEYGRIILEGDVHTQNQKAASLDSRDKAKTFIYAYLYGAGDEKIGSIVAPEADPSEQKQIGKQLREKFEKNTPALKYLQRDVKRATKARGFVRLPDKRRAYIRHQHAALNTLLQGAGSIICKRWIVHFNRTLTERFGPQGWKGQWAALGWIHDEVQLAVRPDIADEVAKIVVNEIRGITDHFNWRIPLDGEAKIGANWAETH